MSYEATVLADSPVSYWRLGDAGNPLLDEQGLHPGTAAATLGFGAPSLVPQTTDDSVLTSPVDPFPGELVFAGSGRGPGTLFPDEFTVELWWKQDVNGLDSGVLVQVARTDGLFTDVGGYELSTNNDNDGLSGFVYLGDTTGGSRLQVYTTAPTGTDPVHVVMTKDSSFVRVYQNGVLAGEQPTGGLTTAYGVSPLQLEMGQALQSTGFDEFAVYDRALSAVEVAEHFQAGTEAPTNYYDVDSGSIFGSLVPSTTTAGDPVETSSGNFTDTWADLGFPGQVFAMDWSRTYNSLDARTGVLGTGWSTVLDVTAEPAGADVVVRAPDGRTVTFADDGGVGWSRPAEFYGDLNTDPDGSYRIGFLDGTAWLFDTAGRLEGFESWDGQTVTIGRDGTGVASAMTSSTGHSLAFAYDAVSGRLVLVAASDGRAVAYGYDTNDALVSVTDPAGAVTTFGVDGAGLLASITDPESRPVVTNVYDATGRVTSQTTPSGNTVTFVYDDVVGTTTVTDGASGDVTVYAHSPQRRLISVTDAEGETVTRSYDGEGNLVAAVDRLASDIVQTFDGNGNLTSRTDREGN
ncbi:MAG: hypothetical protein GY750_01455, partial [Lentisphaerae bacterium]|nr:hypothetical protein [Lentisphaerota bacterium]